jgi:FAD dependent oxidoreductase
MTATESLLNSYRVGKLPLFLIGTFDSGVTVWSQQVRALNLAFALVESEFVSCDQHPDRQKNIAVVGGGFAGLTLAAALIEKQVNAKITIYEQRDTLMPLQQGSDSRWLHPHIYDWPADGSEAGAAMLPVLNWTAARASDVVVQILSEWNRIALKTSQLQLFCNARHLQVDTGDENCLRIEWVGEPRATDGMTDGAQRAVGSSEQFHAVVLAIGFGLEKLSTSPYWRNETFSQPSLDQPRKLYLVAGQGDGAMIDLLRLRISQYRQDRILEELFLNKRSLSTEVKRIHKQEPRARLFDELEKLDTVDHPCHAEFTAVVTDMGRRLRRDTDAILRLRVRKFSDLFEPDRRISFQNRLLVYLLYKCGGFVPSSVPEQTLQKDHAIPDSQFIRRFGPAPEKLLKDTLSDSLFQAVVPSPGVKPIDLLQSDEIRWLGGYFGYPGPTKDRDKLPDALRREWRKEYLPGPTSLLGAALSSSIVGTLRHLHQRAGRLRVTLHRTMTVGEEEFLQQTCDYAGDDITHDQESTAARTFQNDTATIGLAYRCRAIVRSKAGIDPEILKKAMNEIRLPYNSRAMVDGVSFVLAIPLLEPEKNYSLKSPVAGIIYIDSTEPNFFVDDDKLANLVIIAKQFLNDLERHSSFDRVRNQLLSRVVNEEQPVEDIPDLVRDAIELVENIPAPRTSGPFQFNYDYSDFTPAQIEISS